MKHHNTNVTKYAKCIKYYLEQQKQNNKTEKP